jgi:hypothetical protein
MNIKIDLKNFLREIADNVATEEIGGVIEALRNSIVEDEN